MKEQESNQLIQDMNLKPDEQFKIKGNIYRYIGIVKENGKTYDKIIPLTETYFQSK